MNDPYFADDDRMTVFTDMGEITRHNDMGDILSPFPVHIGHEEEYVNAEDV